MELSLASPMGSEGDTGKVSVIQEAMRYRLPDRNSDGEKNERQHDLGQALDEELGRSTSS